MTDHCVPLENFIRTLNVIADFQDVETKDHSRKCRDIALLIGEKLDVAGDDLLYLGYGADIHDVGKLAIEPNILRQPTKLTKSQMASVRKHPEFGVEMLKYAEFPQQIIDCVLYHQEHRDGSGYPFGLVGEEIPFLARIVCVADVWEAITTHRAYRDALSRQSATNFMAHHSTWFDVKVYSAFVSLLRNGEL